ncbi:MAG: winged helix-turn-helix transcriptional regulator [Spirochaetales bacterium]|nr:winged helix-turn-helix transcriptional regulator [Spirochaetales bacterium]
MENQEKELELLQTIHENSHVRQRDLARIIGVSLGMTNAIIKRLVKKGWLKIKKINNRKIKYAVSTDGMDAIMRRSYRYVKRTIKNVVYYKEAIYRLVEDIKTRGYQGILLIGKSDVDFIVEHCCHKFKMTYVKNEDDYKGDIFYLYAESYIPDMETEKTMKNAEFLQKIFLKNIF